MMEFNLNPLSLDDAIDIVKKKDQALALRMDAVLTIVNKFETEYFPLFEEILKDQDESEDIRSCVALALGKISGEIPFQILKSCAKDSNTTVRNYVIQALGMTYQEAAAPLLIQALEDSSNTVFASATEALNMLGSKATPYLIELLSTGADDARCIAAWQLGEMQEQDSIPALLENIKRGSSVSVIALCIWALGEIGLGTDEVLQILSEARKEPEPDVRLRAETAIKKIASHQN